MEELSRQERVDILNDKLAFFIRYGYHIVNRTDVVATILRRKDFDIYYFLFWVLPYLVYFFFLKENYAIYLEVLPDGTVKKLLLD